MYYSKYPVLKQSVRITKRIQACWLIERQAGYDVVLSPYEALALSLCNGLYNFEEIQMIYEKAISSTGMKAVIGSDVSKILQKYSGVINFKDTQGEYNTRYDPTDYMYAPKRGKLDARGRMDAPVALLLVLTHACNFRCSYCFNSSSKPMPNELSTDDWLRIIKEAHDMGITSCTITGGEPMLHEGFFDIITRLTDLDMFPDICTNGSLLDSKAVTRLYDLGVPYTQISFDVSEEKNFDKLVGTNGAFIKVVAGIKRLVAAGIDVNCKGVILPDSVSNIPKLYQFLDELGVSTFRLVRYETGPNCRGGTELLVLERAIADVEEHLKKIKGNMKIHLSSGEPSKRWRSENDIVSCGALVRSVIVLPNGDVSACEKITNNSDFIAGNLCEISLSDLWLSEKADNIVNPPKDKMDKICAECEHLGKCGAGCYAIKERLCNNIYGIDPRCFKASEENNPYAKLGD